MGVKLILALAISTATSAPPEPALNCDSETIVRLQTLVQTPPSVKPAHAQRSYEVLPGDKDGEYRLVLKFPKNDTQIRDTAMTKLDEFMSRCNAALATQKIRGIRSGAGEPPQDFVPKMKVDVPGLKQSGQIDFNLNPDGNYSTEIKVNRGELREFERQNQSLLPNGAAVRFHFGF